MALDLNLHVKIMAIVVTSFDKAAAVTMDTIAAMANMSQIAVITGPDLITFVVDSFSI